MTKMEDAENLLAELTTTKNLLKNNLDEAREKLKTTKDESEKTNLRNQIRGLKKRISDVEHVYNATNDHLKTLRKNPDSGSEA